MTQNDRARDILSSKQRKALAAVLAEPTLVRAAQLAGVAEVTLFRWLREPDFRNALKEAEDEIIDAAVRRLLHAQDTAINTMIDTMTDCEASHAVRLRAAVHTLDYTLRVHSYRRMAQQDMAAGLANSTDEWLAAEDNYS